MRLLGSIEFNRRRARPVPEEERHIAANRGAETRSSLSAAIYERQASGSPSIASVLYPTGCWDLPCVDINRLSNGKH